MKAKTHDQPMQTMMPNSSPATAKMKSAWASGMMRLTVPSPGPTPNQPPRMSESQRHVDLEGVARCRSREAVDAAGDVREASCRRRRRRRRRAPPSADDPQPRHAGHEEQHAPGDDDQHGLAEIGLGDEQRDDDGRAGSGRRGCRECRCARDSRRTARRQTTTKAGFRNSDGWIDRPASVDPAPRALDLDADEQRRQHQHERRRPA